MSEEVNTSPSASEPAQPEPISEPSKGRKKKNLLLMIVAVIVAIALISTVAVVMLWPKDDTLTLESEISPSDTITIPAGARLDLAVNSTLSNKDGDVVHDIDSWTNVTYRWSKTPTELGTFDLVAKRVVVLTAARSEMTGTVSCLVTFGDQSVTVDAAVTVSPPALDRVEVTPSTKTVPVGDSQVLTASATNTVGEVMTGVSFTWSVWNMSEDQYTLSSTTGASVTFTGLVEDAEGLVNATATVGGVTKTGSAAIRVGEPPSRTVDYYFYDMFEVPFGEWWDMRWVTYGDEEPITDEYPYIYKWYGEPEGNFWWYTNMRMNLTGRNMPELNMQDNAEFLPFLGTSRGGTAKINWYMQYMTEEEMSVYPDSTSDWFDGWVISLNGTVTLDSQAAMTVLGVTSEGLDNFASWWASNNASVNQRYLDWSLTEGGRDRLDIYNMYEYPLTFMTHRIWAEKVGDEVVLNYNLVSWGMEALMTRWMHEAFMETEWYFEDMYFNAVIGPESADLDVDAVAVYAAYAYETAEEAAPCWMWEALLQDYIESTAPHPVSDYDIYSDKTYLMLSPGSPLYGEWMKYDYAPGAWNLSENETLRLTWPAGDQMFYKHDPLQEGGVELKYGPMRVDSAEPMGTDLPDNVVIDQDARMITYTGPIDMWTWSKDQTAHEGLESEWERVGLLPYGMPTVEFRLAGEPEPNRLEVVLSPATAEAGDAVDATVTVYDQYNEVFPTYTGTVNFTSTDPLAVLPANYTFLAGDNGVHAFTGGVSFGTTGLQTVTVVDTVIGSLRGESNEVTVTEAPVPTYFVVEDVTSPILKGVPSGFKVTVMDQFDHVATGYRGTVVFSSNDTEATFVPEQYEFTEGDAGVHVFTDAVVFGTAGYHDLSASDDVSDPAISGAQLMILVLELHFEASYTYVSEPPELDLVIANETEVTLTISVKDQRGVVYTDYVGTVLLDTEDMYAAIPESAEFTADDDGVIEVPGFVMGTLGTQTVTMTDQDDETITGHVDIEVSAAAEMDHFYIDLGGATVQLDVAETFMVSAMDQYDRVFPDYAGSVYFCSNDSSATLPPVTPFVPASDHGVREFEVTYHAEGIFNLTVWDQGHLYTGEATDIFVTSEEEVIDRFVVEGISSGQWSGNVSTVKVTAMNQWDRVFKDYEGTVTFSTDAPADTYELPPDTAFVPADYGVKTLSPVRFDEAGTYSVTVKDTVTTTAEGSQVGILVLERPVADWIELEVSPTLVMMGVDEITLTVTVYDQEDRVHVWYEGTVLMTCTDSAATGLPSEYTFTAGDAGVHEFSGIVMNTAGTQTITVTDEDDTSVTATTEDITVEAPPPRAVTFRIYDMFKEPWRQFWTDPVWGRSVVYDDSYYINNGEYNTMIYYPGDSRKVSGTTWYQGIVFAPYRLTMDGENLDELSVTEPAFMPVLGTGTGVGAEVQLDVYMQYLTDAWWDGWWVPTWSGYTGWRGDDYFPQLIGAEASDGYHLGTVYNVTMNRAAAALWLGMPTDANPTTWWSANGNTYRTAWVTWVEDQGDEQFPIVNAYEWEYYDLGTTMKIAVLGDGDIKLTIGHINWGYEVLLCKWLNALGLFNHQPWYEDLDLSVTYGEETSELMMDTVCQWSLHAVKANGTVESPAWAWEPTLIDYGIFDSAYPSDYEDYVDLKYQSWNAGDEMFSYPVMYDATPTIFELGEEETLVFQLPMESDVIGYKGKAVPAGTYGRLYSSGGTNTADYDAIEVAGSMTLGYSVTNPAAPVNLASMYNSGTRTLTIPGPQTFNQVRHPTAELQLYHGAPWIEFNIVVPPKALVPDAEPVAVEPSAASVASVVPAGTSAAAEAMSMMAVVAAVVLTVAALGCNVRCRPE